MILPWRLRVDISGLGLTRLDHCFLFYFYNSAWSILARTSTSTSTSVKMSTRTSVMELSPDNGQLHTHSADAPKGP